MEKGESSFWSINGRIIMPSEVEKILQVFIDQAQGTNFDLAGCQKHLEECRRRLGIGPFSADENV